MPPLLPFVVVVAACGESDPLPPQDAAPPEEMVSEPPRTPANTQPPRPGRSAVSGMPREGKVGPMLEAESGTVWTLVGLDAWPDGVAGRAVTVVGRAERIRMMPEARVDEDGSVSQGVAPGSGLDDVLVVQRWEFVDRPAHGHPAPWALTYADGSGNRTLLRQEAPQAPVSWSYDPVTPAESSSGTYSGGVPAQGSVSAAAAARIWQHFEAVEGDFRLPTEGRALGTGSVLLETAEIGSRRWVVKRSPRLDAFEATLGALREEDAARP